MPDRMPNRMSEDMSDRMPEDLPVRKCINVMVGITRSKVIWMIYLLKMMILHLLNVKSPDDQMVLGSASFPPFCSSTR